MRHTRRVRKAPLLPGASHFVIAIAGAVRADVSSNILSTTYDAKLNRLEVSLNNADASGKFLYSDSDLLLPGTQVTLYVDQANTNTLLFDGTISSFAPNFSAAAGPTLTLIATGRRRRRQRLQAYASFGENLIEFFPILEGGIINCTGIVDGNPNIQQRTILTVAGVGQAFSRGYIVSSAIHVFDATKGYTTRFYATADLRP